MLEIGRDAVLAELRAVRKAATPDHLARCWSARLFGRWMARELMDIETLRSRQDMLVAGPDPEAQVMVPDG